MTFEYSLWWMLLALPLAALIGWYTYFYGNPPSHWSRGLRITLAALRTVVVLLIAVLLLRPMIKRDETHLEKPAVLVFFDQSLSVDSAESAALAAKVDSMLKSADNPFQTELYKFAGKAVSINDTAHFQKLHTDYSAIYQRIDQTWLNRNIAAAVVITDGNLTRGADPAYLVEKYAFPTYIIGLGDTTVKPDLELDEVFSNRYAFLQNKFEIRARVRAKKFSGNDVSVVVQKEGKNLIVKDWVPQSKDEVKDFSFLLTADEPGIQRYTVRVSSSRPEEVTDNNAKSIFVEILENRRKIGIVARAPHPDIAAIKQAAEQSEQYSIDVLLNYAEMSDNELSNYDLLVIHGMPATQNHVDFLNRLFRVNVPLWVIYTTRCEPKLWNAVFKDLQLFEGRTKPDEVSAWVNEDFSVFSPIHNEYFYRYPPLEAPFGDPQIRSEAQVLYYQRLGNVETNRPLMVYTVSNESKRAYLLGEGLWRWRLFERMLYSQDLSDRLVQKTLQYLALRQNRKRLNLTWKERTEEGERVIFEAEYYNKSYEIDNQAEVRIKLKDMKNAERAFTMPRHMNGYRLDLGTLPPGEYSFTAWVAGDAGDETSVTGRFVVVENKAEFAEVNANHRLLQRWAAASGGAFFTPDVTGQLVETVNSLPSAKTIIRTTTRWEPLISWKWLLFAIAALVAGEWFLRKYNGSY